MVVTKSDGGRSGHRDAPEVSDSRQSHRRRERPNPVAPGVGLLARACVDWNPVLDCFQGLAKLIAVAKLQRRPENGPQQRADAWFSLAQPDNAQHTGNILVTDLAAGDEMRSKVGMRHKIGLAIAAAASLGLGALGSASAADMPVKALPPVIVPFSWTGFYVGGFVGGAWTNSVSSPDATNPATVVAGAFTFPPGVPAACDGGTPGLKAGCIANYNMGSSVVAGGTAGYNWQAGKIVAGVEGEIGYIHLSGGAPLPFVGGAPCGAPCPVTFNTTLGDWYGTLAGRLGVTMDAFNPAWSNHLLLYVKGGAAVTRLASSENFVAAPPLVAANLSLGGASTIWGWVAGAGAEWALNQNWSVKGEYEYLGFDNRSAGGCGILPLGAAGVGGTWCYSTHVSNVQIAKVGVNYRFGGPVVAKY
jgi:outer membrane immunogenic protein